MRDVSSHCIGGGGTLAVAVLPPAGGAAALLAPATVDLVATILLASVVRLLRLRFAFVMVLVGVLCLVSVLLFALEVCVFVLQCMPEPGYGAKQLEHPSFKHMT
jgi:hypothetical protein